MKRDAVPDAIRATVVFLATAFGAVLANLYASSHERRSRDAARFITVGVFSLVVAVGIVLHDERRRPAEEPDEPKRRDEARIRKRERFKERVASGFSHGFAWRGASDAVELFIYQVLDWFGVG